MSLKVQGADKYSPEKLTEFEKNVETQLASSTFNLDANLALLRLYQFHPSLIKVPVIVKILLKAITQLPGAEYKACIHLVHERLQAEEDIARVMEMAAALESGRLNDFWNKASSSRDLIAAVPGFYEAVRSFSVHLLSISFRKVSRKVLAESVALEGITLEQMIQARVLSSGWSLVSSPGGDLIVLPRSEHNQIVVKRTQDVITFDQIAPVLAAVTVGY
ncbi:MAG: hypothetical protein WDW38_004312 [Sanguina aurantia]